MSYGRYKKYHPLLYRPRHPILWWVKKWAYTRFILREMTSLAVMFYAIVLVLYVNAVAKGPEAFAAFSEWLASPLSITLHSVAFCFAVFHSYTWFNLAPKAIVIRVGKKKIPGSAIMAANYAMWAAVSVALYWVFTTI